jgi:hypothetical protein
MDQITQVGTMILLSGLLYLLHHGVKYLREKTDNELVKGALHTIEETIYSVVCEINQTHRKSLPSKLSDPEKESLKTMAIEEVTGMLSDDVKKMVRKNIKNFEGYIGGKIEMAVKKQKERGQDEEK